MPFYSHRMIKYIKFYIVIFFSAILLSCGENEELINFGYKVVVKIELYEKDNNKLPDSLSQLIPIYITEKDSALLMTHFKYKVNHYNPSDSSFYLQNNLPFKDYFSLELFGSQNQIPYYHYNVSRKNFDFYFF